ncbi:MAG: hypothetical protein ACYC69_05155 [Thermodesulfovibrionales bacterium]
MSRFDFTPLYNDYPAVIALMPNNFSSHEFILVLAQRNQGAYIEALYEYRPDTDPFQVVHGVLSKHLYECNNLVRHAGGVDSTDIFGNSNRCASWTKV